MAVRIQCQEPWIHTGAPQPVLLYKAREVGNGHLKCVLYILTTLLPLTKPSQVHDVASYFLRGEMRHREVDCVAAYGVWS